MATRPVAKGVVESVIAEHAEEAALAWILRDAAVGKPHFSLRTLGILENRLEGHLDGLRIAGDAGWAQCRSECHWNEPGEVFSAAILALESGDATRIADIFGIATGSPGQTRALVSALGWLPWKMVQTYVESLAGSEIPLARRAAIAAYAVSRRDPADRLQRLLEDCPLVRGRAFRAVGELGRRDLLGAVRKGLGDGDDTCRFWAAFSGSLLGDETALGTLCTFASGSGPQAERAALVAARALPLPASMAWQHELARHDRLARIAVNAAGAIGNPAAIPWLIEQMTQPPLARAAAEAFTIITGVDIAYQDLDGKPPEGFQPGPTDDPGDDNVALDPDEHMPFPNPERVARWWSSNGGMLKSGIRHLAGRPLERSSLERILRTGRQRVRAAAALELTLMQPGRPLFEVRGPVRRQRAALAM